MNPETLTRLNALACEITAFLDDLKLDPSVDSQWTVGMLESTLAGMNLRLGCQYGIKLNPRLPVSTQ